LDVEAESLDFIDICTPPRDHASIADAALEHGLHVLCEKPLTCSLEEGRSLLAHAKTVQRVLFPCHNYKHAPMIKAIREIIHSGQIGAVRSATLNTWRDTHAKGVSEWHPDWRRESRYSGGGIAMDHGSHSFYLAFDWFGAFPTSVSAKMSNLDHAKYDTEDDFSAILSYPTGMAHVHLTWTAGVRSVIYTIRGEKGVITMNGDTLKVEITNGAPGAGGTRAGVNRRIEKRFISSNWADASHTMWFNSLFDQFRDAIDRGDFAGREAQEAVFCVHLINTAYRSAQQGSRELPLA
jgi:predicted dehydrogenase